MEYKVQGQPVHLLVDELKKDGVIDKAMFGVLLTTTGKQSKIHFGGYDYDFVQKSIEENGDNSETADGIFWMNIDSDYHWQVKIYNATFGDNVIDISASKVIFDTGSSLNYIPTQEYN